MVNALQVKLTEGGKDYVLKSRTTNLKAWAAYMNCFKYWEKFTKEDNERSKGFAEQAIALDPGHFRSQIALARLSLLERDVDKAEELYVKASSLDPGSRVPYVELSRIYASKKQWEKAEAELKKMVQKADGPKYQKLLILGRFYESRKDWTNAETNYQEAVDREIVSELRIARVLSRLFVRFPHLAFGMLKQSDRTWRTVCGVLSGELKYSDIKDRTGGFKGIFKRLLRA